MTNEITRHKHSWCNEKQSKHTALEQAYEDEELREEACEGRDACQGEEAERHKEGEARVGLIEPGVVVDANLASVLLNRGEHGEGAEVGGEINEEVEDQGGHALCGAVHNAEHEVAGLRDGGEGHGCRSPLLVLCLGNL